MLHVHSTYSMLQSTVSIDDIISHAKQNGNSFAVLTDTNRMNGLIQFFKAAKVEGIKPILGTQITDPLNEKEYIILLAKNNSGYSELCKVITARNLKDDFSLVKTVTSISDNLFIISNSIILVQKLLEQNFNFENYYAELISAKGHKRHTRQLYELACKHNIKYVAGNPVYFASNNDYLLHKVVSAIRLNTTLASLKEDDIADKEFHFVDSADFYLEWKNLPKALENIEFIAANCNVDLKLGKYKFPSYNLPQYETPFSYLWKICTHGLSERYSPVTDKILSRLNYELSVIDELGFCDYFLVVADIVNQAHKKNMMTIGRGSAANSLVAYCLGLTQVDPIEQNLYFERFLNKGRKSPPDIDLDFSWRERDEIVRYVFEKYGYDKVAMISTTVTFRARSAFRETAKVFGISNGEITKYSKFIPWTSAKNLSSLAEKFPESKSLDFSGTEWGSIIELASRLAGFPRHLSIHPGGIIITEKPITNYVALEYASNKGLGLIITQPDMYPIEDLGLIKIDLLSQRSLGVLRDTLTRIETA